MEPKEFAAYHAPALEQDEIRHNVILGVLGRLEVVDVPGLGLWTLGPPGACAIQWPGFSIVLGEVTQGQCRALAEETCARDHPGVAGPDRAAVWFVERAIELGHTFLEPMPQQILALHAKPKYPGVPGHARPVTAADADLFLDWMCAFSREAIPHDPPPTRERLQRPIDEGRFQFWIVDGAPVSMAGIMRRTRHAAAIAGVYTPPALRGRGYAGSVTAAVVEAVFAEGRSAACLYVDLRNPFSSRCYAKIGFTPVCESWMYPRALGGRE
jgi:RimJ/RimL family protein N-acetyltransferase